MREKKEKTIAVRISHLSYEKLLKLAEQRESGVSSIIREAVAIFLAQR